MSLNLFNLFQLDLLTINQALNQKIQLFSFSHSIFCMVSGLFFFRDNIFFATLIPQLGFFKFEPTNLYSIL